MKTAEDGVERIVASEARRFIQKDPSKLKLVAGLYALSGAGLELGKVARASYFFVRHLDDLLDGEIQGEADPIGFAEDLRDQITTRQFRASPRIGRLAAYALPALERRGRPDDNPAGDFIQVIDAMMFDHQRAKNRQTLTAEELKKYYYNVLDPGTNLMLIGFCSDLRIRDIPSFSPNLGRLYSVRDIEKDWELGFVNIPSEILVDASLDRTASIGEMTRSPDIQAWFNDEVADASANLHAIRSDLPTNERLTSTVMNGFISQAVTIQPPSLS